MHLFLCYVVTFSVTHYMQGDFFVFVFVRACTLTFCCQQSVPRLAVLLLRKTKLEILFYDVFICAPQDFPSMQLPVNVCALVVSKSLMCKNCNSKCW